MIGFLSTFCLELIQSLSLSLSLLFPSLCACGVCGYVCVFVGVMLTEAEELYQKRVLTITGICVALLVVGIVCVVAYCKTK